MCFVLSEQTVTVAKWFSDELATSSPHYVCVAQPGADTALTM